jgi:hypothetical protein
MSLHADERWLPIPGYVGLYEVSDQGRIRSLDRIVTFRDGKRRLFKGQLIRSRSRRDGYRLVTLSRNGQIEHWLVQHLVMLAFVGLRPEGAVVCHGNGVRDDNRPSNLRYDSYSENNFDLVRHGKHHHARKTHCKWGHEFTPENTAFRPNSQHRCCLTCRQTNNRRNKQRQRERSARVAR